MRAAIYARRSTDEHQAASLDVQDSEARRYIERKGWTVAPEHVYVDDAISRAEFKKRPALIAMLNAAEAHAFDVVVTRDETRLGGDMNRLGLLIQDLLDSGTRLFYYYADEEVLADNAVSKFLVVVRGFAAELEREKIAQRTHEHLQTKARRGFNVGGRVYGYDNIEVKDGGQRTRVEYRINEKQADVVRDIFGRYVDGQGIRAIAKDLNIRGIAPPSAGKRGTGSWSPSCVREMLLRERYRGVLIWGREGKAYKGGTRIRVARAEDEWVKVERPELRIVSEELWSAAEARREKSRRFTGRVAGKGPKPRYLLTGLSKCGECGGPMQATNGKQGTEVVKVYTCAWHRSRGDAVCTSSTRRPVALVDAPIIEFIKSEILCERLVVETLKEVRRRLAQRAEGARTEEPALEAELRKLHAEVERFTLALVSTDEKPEAIVRAIGERERRIGAIKAQLESLRGAPSVIDVEVRRLEQEARRRLKDFEKLLAGNPDEARKAVEKLVDSPLKLTPFVDDKGAKRFKVEGVIARGALFTTDCDPNGI